MKRRFDIETEDLPNIRRQKNYKLVHISNGNQLIPQPTSNILKQTQFVPRVELKNYDFWVDGFTVPNDQTWHAGFCINSMDQGTTAYQRIGRKINMKKVQLRYWFGDNSSGNGPAKFRILIVYDKQFNTVVPAISEVLDLHFTAPDPAAFNNLGNSDRFIIVADVITECSLSFYDVPFGLISRNVQLDTIFNSTAAGINGQSINTGGLIMYVCQVLVPLVTPTVMYFHSRVRYTDD